MEKQESDMTAKNNTGSADILKDERKSYTKPVFSLLGSVATITLGNGGSSIDGNMSDTQTGGGNDGRGPHLY